MLYFLLGAVTVLAYWLVFWSASRMKLLKKHAFNIGYKLFVDTPLGKHLTRREFKAAEKTFPNGHSEQRQFTYGDLCVTPIAYGLDNYGYVVVNRAENTAVVVDVGYGVGRVQQYLAVSGARLLAVLITHKHWDHCLSAHTLSALHSDCAVYGSGIDRAHGVTHMLQWPSNEPSDCYLTLGAFNIRAHLTRGHTHGHVVYELSTQQHTMLFTGDLLFQGGVGRLFEGTASDLVDSLGLLIGLGEECLVWPGHEYTRHNCMFAASVDPDNEQVQAKLTWAQVHSEERIPTCPSSLAEEKQYNPFLRVLFDTNFRQSILKHQTKEKDDFDEIIGANENDRNREQTVEAMRLLRLRKDNFKIPNIAVATL